MMEWTTWTALVVVVFINGCAMQSFLFNTENERGGFVVTKPPIQITYRGDISETQHRYMLEVIDKASVVPFQDYKFNENHKIMLNSIDGKSDHVEIKLQESTNTRQPPPYKEGE